MSTTPAITRTPWAKAIAIGAGASLAILLIVLAFLWPAKTASPHDLPLSVAGPEQAVAAIETQLEASAPGVFDVHRAADRDAAVEQIKTRETYGAIVLGGATDATQAGQAGDAGQVAHAAPEVLTAPAGGAAPTQILTGLAATLQQQLTAQAQAAGVTPTPTVKVTAVVPLSEHDPNGAGLTAAAFPLALGGVLGGVLVAQLIHGTWQRFAAATTFAAAAGGLLVWVLQGWFEFLQGNAGLNFLAIMLTVLATATFMIGCVKLLGRPGLALGPIVTVLIGNPLAGTAMPWQFIPDPWGAIGQFLVPGAGNTLLRDLSYFPDANTTQQWLTLIAWIALGAVLAIVGHTVHSRRRAAAVDVPDDAAPAPSLVEA